MRIIAGSAGGRRLKTLAGRATRPTADRVKEGLFSAIAARIPGARVLDTCAGSGALGLEALSRGAASALFIEADRQAAAITAANIAALGFTEARLLRGDALRLLPRVEESFDLIFLDPPYDIGLLPRLLDLLSRLPLLDAAGLIVAETAAASGEAQHPAFTAIKQSRYGDTVIHYLRPADAKGGQAHGIQR